MATTLKLRTDIKKLKGALSSKSLPAPIKAKLKAQLDKAQNELKAMQSGAKPRKVSTTKGTQTALTSLQKLVNKKKYSVYQGKGIDLKKDADQGALAVGRRVSKGIKGNQFGDAKSSKGNVYYEYRANRLDVKQPKKAQKYPKLEDGGMMAKGGKVRSQEEFNKLVLEKQKIVKNLSPKEVAEMWNKNSNSPSKMTEEEGKMSSSKMYLADLLVENELTEVEHNKYFAHGGKTQGYDDKEDERLGMKYGKMSSKDLNSTHSRRDDARFEERGKMAKGGELKVSTYHLMPLVMTNDKMMTPKYDYIITFEGTEDEALAKAKDMLNKEVVNVHVSLINPNAKSLLNRRKTIAMVKDKMEDGGMMAQGGVIDVEDIKNKIYGYFKAWLGNYISDEELVNSIKRKLGTKYFRFFKGDTMVNDWRSIENSLKSRNNRDFLKENMEISLEENSLEIYNSKNEKLEKGGKTKEEPMVVRGYFEDEAYEYKDGGYVAVSETKDGYWYIMSKPSTKEHAELFIKMGVPRGEVGKVVTIDEAKKHGKLVGKEYLEHGGYMAKGGITDKEVVESNAEMVLSKIKEVHHHADELGDIVTNKSDIEAWVVAKIERASTDLSDITHYLDGQHEKMSMGGSISNYVHKMDKK
jgi:hypothetical protein